MFTISYTEVEYSGGWASILDEPHLRVIDISLCKVVNRWIWVVSHSQKAIGRITDDCIWSHLENCQDLSISGVQGPYPTYCPADLSAEALLSLILVIHRRDCDVKQLFNKVDLWLRSGLVLLVWPNSKGEIINQRFRVIVKVCDSKCVHYMLGFSWVNVSFSNHNGFMVWKRCNLEPDLIGRMLRFGQFKQKVGSI